MAERGSPTRAPVHCVLWHAPDAPPTPELTSLLAQRGVSLETASNPYAATAKVCRLERAARVRQRPGAEGAPEGESADRPVDPPSLVLLLCEPARLPARDLLARVLELHAPRTLCWVYEQSSGPRLRVVPLAQIGATDPTSPSASPAKVDLPGSAPTRPASPPRPIRLAAASATMPVPPQAGPGPIPTVAASESPMGQAPINTGSVLTDDELAMLLSDADDPMPRRGRTSSQEPPRSHRP